MKVLVLGLPRTGTQSIAEALAVLGISPVYHMRDVGKNQHQGLWIEAIEGKFEGGEKKHSDDGGEEKEGEKGEKEEENARDNARWPWGCEEFDRIVGGYEALSDFPAAIFPRELAAAYPEASIILSVRTDEDAWFASMMSTLWHNHTHRMAASAAASAGTGPSPPPSPPSMVDLAKKYHDHCWAGDFPRHGREAYCRHNQLVRDLAGTDPEGTGETKEEKKRKFLEYEAGSGWAPLCGFLGLPLPPPDVPFPRQDDWAEYKKEVVEAERKEAAAEEEAEAEANARGE